MRSETDSDGVRDVFGLVCTGVRAAGEGAAYAKHDGDELLEGGALVGLVEHLYHGAGGVERGEADLERLGVVEVAGQHFVQRLEERTQKFA